MYLLTIIIYHLGSGCVYCADIETNRSRIFTVLERSVFLLGDNREYSNDSRFWKLPYISYDDIKGKYMGQVGFSIRYIIDQKLGRL